MKGLRFGVPRFAAWRSLLDLLVGLSIVAVSAVAIWRMLSPSVRAAPQRQVTAPARRAPSPVPTEPISIADAATQGQKSARIAIIEYSDFQCPYCGLFAKSVMPTLIKNQIASGEVLFAFRHFPLDSIHRFARGAAESAECARKQNRFWQMHDLLFQDQKALSDQTILKDAASAGLDMKLYSTCLESEAKNSINHDVSEAKNFVVTGTPTFLFGVVRDDGRIQPKVRRDGTLELSEIDAVLKDITSQLPLSARDK